MTREEFESDYAANSGCSVDDLHALDLYGVPCDCGEPGCKGWQMSHLSTLLQRCFQLPHDYLPPRWNVQELLDVLIADGKTELVFSLRQLIEMHPELEESEPESWVRSIGQGELSMTAEESNGPRPQAGTGR